MIAVKFRTNCPLKTKTYLNDWRHAFRLAVETHIASTFKVRKPVLEKSIPVIYDDVKQSEMLEITWNVDDNRVASSVKIFYLDFCYDPRNPKRKAAAKAHHARTSPSG